MGAGRGPPSSPRCWRKQASVAIKPHVIDDCVGGGARPPPSSRTSSPSRWVFSAMLLGHDVVALTDVGLDSAWRQRLGFPPLSTTGSRSLAETGVRLRPRVLPQSSCFCWATYCAGDSRCCHERGAALPSSGDVRVRCFCGVDCGNAGARLGAAPCGAAVLAASDLWGKCCAHFRDGLLRMTTAAEAMKSGCSCGT